MREVSAKCSVRVKVEVQAVFAAKKESEGADAGKSPCAERQRG
jgi:hypothetical protein